MLRSFKADPYFLQKYYVGSAIAMPLAVLLLLHFYTTPVFGSVLPWLPITLLFCTATFREVAIAFILSIYLFIHRNLSIGPWELLAMGSAGIYVGIWSCVLLHNASHSSIKPRWLNRLVGELTGHLLLTGFPGFALIHIEHHKHADNLELDPHPAPPGMSFYTYLRDMGKKLPSTFYRMYLETWNNDAKYLESWRLVKYLVVFNRAFRAALVLALLGPKLFIFFFIPAAFAVQMSFVYVNYFSHRRETNGSVEILNLDETLFAKTINRGFSGLLYHRNHHLRPEIFNPMKVKIDA